MKNKITSYRRSMATPAVIIIFMLICIRSIYAVTVEDKIKSYLEKNKIAVEKKSVIERNSKMLELMSTDSKIYQECLQDQEFKERFGMTVSLPEGQQAEMDKLKQLSQILQYLYKSARVDDENKEEKKGRQLNIIRSQVDDMIENMDSAMIERANKLLNEHLKTTTQKKIYEDGMERLNGYLGDRLDNIKEEKGSKRENELKALGGQCPNIYPTSIPVTITPVPVATTQPSCIDKMKVHDQGNLGVCYAHVAAQIVDCRLHNEGQLREGEYVSPILMGLGFKYERIKDKTYTPIAGDRAIESGTACDAINKSRGRHICRGDILNMSALRGRETEMARYEALEEYAESCKVTELLSVDIVRLVDTVLEVTLKLKDALGINGNREKEEKELKDLLMRDAKSLLSASGEFGNRFKTTHIEYKNKVSLLTRMLEGICRVKNATLQPNRPLECIATKEGESVDMETTHTQILDSLGKGMPIGVGLRAGFIVKGPDWKEDKGISDEEKSKLSTGHAVMIIGTRFNPQKDQCEYLVRNSWGTSCNPISKEYECLPHNGSFWIPARIFLNSEPGIEIFR
ncbi:MAG: hypothetical protein HQK51_10995 [Oligoflexia bacterium]|nr:hypothetical protein [Oligoflexia bacterium]